MAGYPVQRRCPPVIMRETARRRARDSGTLSGTSAEEEQMTGKSFLSRTRHQHDPGRGSPELSGCDRIVGAHEVQRPVDQLPVLSLLGTATG
jgi:hypothetical protein